MRLFQRARFVVAASLLLVGCPEATNSKAPQPRPAVATDRQSPTVRQARPAKGAKPEASLGADSSSESAASGELVGSVQLLRARHPLGVPLHAKPHQTSVSGRLAHQTRVVVIALDAGDPNWLHVRDAQGKSGWIVRRYLADERARSSGRAAQGPATLHLPQDSPWSSPSACRRALGRGPPGGSKSSDLSIATWNVRWFPDGGPGKNAKPPGTDLSWMACSLALLDADVVALQEFKTLPRAHAALAQVLEEVKALSGRSYRAHFDDCPSQATQHVGVLVDERLDAKARTIGSINPHDAPCRDSLRPGLLLSFSYGTKTLDLVSIHLKSGTGRRSYELRRATWRRMLDFAQSHDGPLMFAGDFNSMGCARCSPEVSAAEEKAAFERLMAPAGLELAPVEPSCSHYYRGDPGLLDGFAAPSGFASGSAEAFGLCQALACEPASANRASFFRSVSDHCPLRWVVSSKTSSTSQTSP